MPEIIRKKKPTTTPPAAPEHRKDRKPATPVKLGKQEKAKAKKPTGKCPVCFAVVEITDDRFDLHVSPENAGKSKQKSCEGSKKTLAEAIVERTRLMNPVPTKEVEKEQDKETEERWWTSAKAIAFASEKGLTPRGLKQIFGQAERWQKQVAIGILPIGSEFHVPGLDRGGKVAGQNDGETLVEFPDGRRAGWSTQTKVMPEPAPRGGKNPKPIVNGNESPAPKGNGGFGKARTEVLGFAATAVVRALGKLNIDIREVSKALERLGVELSPSTIKIQHRAGQTGDRGEPAPLTKKQVADLLGKK